MRVVQGELREREVVVGFHVLGEEGDAVEAVGYAGVVGGEFYAGEGAVGEEEGVGRVFLDAVGGGLVRVESGVFFGLGRRRREGGGEEKGGRGGMLRLGVEGLGFFVVAGLEAPRGGC